MFPAWRFVMVMTAALLLSACSSLVKVNLESAGDLNGADDAEPLPVVVRIYRLSEESAFKNASFQDLWKREQATLGATLIGVKEVVLQPDSKETVELPLDERTKFVAGVALFRNPASSQWGFLEPIADHFMARQWHKAVAVKINLRLTQNRIEVIE